MWKMNQYLPLFLIASCLFFISHSQTISNTSSQHRCLPEQSSALLQLRKEFVEERTYPDDYYGVSYPKMKSWKADTDCCSSWDGVTCDAHNGHVIGLDLSNSWLCGPLNSNCSLFRLRHLQKLDLALNDFSSSTPIPSEFGQLVRLTHLNLSHSFLHGRIPSEISWLSNLVSLDLSSNYFEYSVGADFYVTYLNLRRNDLEALVQNMTYLRELHLDDVNISSSLPQSLANLSSLTSLSLPYCNLLGEFPSDIFLLPKIQAIDVSGNYNLTGFLPNFRSGSSLKKLRLSSMNFSGELLDAIGNLKSLNFLDLSQSYFSRELPNSIGNLEYLSHLDLSRTNFLGELPKSIGNLKSLSYLDLNRANFSGELPNSIGNLKSLSYLDLFGANFSGELPSSIGKLESLNALYLSGTIFSGKLPDSIGNLSSLNYLELGSSKFSGEIPPSIGNLSQLTYLSLDGSNFHGQLPSTLGNLAKLTFLDLSYSLFSGKVPSSLGNLTQLEKLLLSYNNFEGRFPVSLTNITKLTQIDISGNQLKGSIPSEISRLTNLSFLGLSQNSLTGAIPLVLYTMPSLSRLYLDQNQLTGPLQFQNISSSQLNTLLLSGNKLDGPVPRSIANFTKLQVLYLSSINLKDKVELNIFFQVKKLQSLDLSGNNLLVSKENINSTHHKFLDLYLSSCNLREFPDFLKAQNKLQNLDLSNNSIEGKIPKWFCNVGKGTLQNLNLSFNLLSGFEQPLKVLPWKFIYYLDLRSNMLQGSLPIPPLSTRVYFASNNNLTRKIPQMICMVNSLEVLDISNNQLIGQIPQCLSHFSNSLLVLNMRNNCFQGNLPKSFMKGCSLMTLDFSHNQIQGKIPQSLVQCQMLEVLNLGNNNINDAFPFWLQSLPELRILVLRANGFHGPIWTPHTRFGFSKLHVIDLSHNNFSGRLPLEYFKTWNAMLMVPAKDNSQPEYMGSQIDYYKDSITVVNKGIEIFLVKILTIFMAIDLSNNRFYGEIPNSVGNLKGLIVLNLSSNSFMGHFPSSLGNLTELESLDLSQNKLSSEIPQQLIGLTFLEYLNLSYNHLVGPIPQGGQFSTFEISSFEGNFGLCGSPLPNKCGNNNETQSYETRHESSIVEGFDWKVVVIGYACGLIIGLVIGYFATSRRTIWFLRNFGVHLHR
ncbi:receptor-like protein 53 [Quercus robur]|uniref:receptor-like protein 53 n=1 Tax=Quercus robur TaxID=38942 RepID=UPI002162E060|nr:receptor-like protein 53 [Quercus robur]XP_050289796.1 receptor-like protein 53 [Quercus robur]XP_050289801.1 receptor-like protein 53 [Quercus robur]XP_050289806.1 receptor-like protein 53 [Quercus robur]XP_050289810.1 receptor-like protein 53 [Quercus robur]XP_050289815.1 receptor-like protein 53 [Quercus robur]XP_050289821.1 receptor-like protein 53 [Quercus robur]